MRSGRHPARLHAALVGEYSSMATPTYERPTHVTLTRRQGVASRVIHSSCGARESVAAHGLHRPTQERPATESPTVEPTQRWCSDWGKERANVTGKSARADGMHPSWALGLDSTEAASRWSRETSPVTLPTRGRPLGGWHSEEAETA
jgi:hypothetical protein